MTTRLRTSNLEQESNFDEGVGELSVEEKYAEVKQLIVDRQRKRLSALRRDLRESSRRRSPRLPEELDEIYIRFADLGIDVVEDSEKPLQTNSKGIVTIDGTIEEKEMDQREEVQQDIIAASSGIVDKTNDPVRMYLREMGTVKLLDRQGEVDIAKRIEKGERKVYKALSAEPHHPRRDPEDLRGGQEGPARHQRDDRSGHAGRRRPSPSPPTRTASRSCRPPTINKITDIMAIFEKIAKLDKKIKDAKTKLADPKKLSERTLAARRERSIEKLEHRARRPSCAQIDFTAADAQPDDQQAEGHRQRAVADPRR